MNWSWSRFWQRRAERGIEHGEAMRCTVESLENRQFLSATPLLVEGGSPLNSAVYMPAAKTAAAKIVQPKMLGSWNGTITVPGLGTNAAKLAISKQTAKAIKGAITLPGLAPKTKFSSKVTYPKNNQFKANFNIAEGKGTITGKVAKNKMTGAIKATAVTGEKITAKFSLTKVK